MLIVQQIRGCRIIQHMISCIRQINLLSKINFLSRGCVGILIIFIYDKKSINSIIAVIPNIIVSINIYTIHMKYRVQIQVQISRKANVFIKLKNMVQSLWHIEYANTSKQLKFS